MTHVAICADGIFPAEVGGIQRHSNLLVRSLARDFPELGISVLHTHTKERLFADLPRVNEIHVDPRPGKRQYLLECYDLSGRMAEALRELPDAVIYAQGLTVWKNARLFAGRLINNPHGMESFQGLTVKDRIMGFPFRRGFRSVWRHSRHVVSLGGRLTTILRRHLPAPDRQIVVLPNGVELPAEARVRSPSGSGESGACRLLFVGRFAGNKGIPDLLAAMAMLAAAGESKRFVLHLVGTGPLYADLRGSNQLPNVIFHGAVDDAALDRLYFDSDVFVLPTLFEGMPTVVLEAMARGLPVIVTDVGATRELVDESNGWIIPKRDPRALAAALSRFAALSPEKRASHGAASLAKVHARFTWSQVAKAHARVFDRLHAELHCHGHAPR